MELMIAIAIMVVITSVVLVKHASFNSTILLKNLAYDLSLSIREVQISAISVKRSGDSFDFPHGIYFNATNTNEYIFFRDDSIPPIVGTKNKYDPAEKYETININDNFKIKDLCRVRFDKSQICDFEEVSIIFERPEFDARINIENINGDSEGASGTDLDNVLSVEIILSGTADNTLERKVTVNRSGYISVDYDE